MYTSGSTSRLRSRETGDRRRDDDAHPPVVISRKHWTESVYRCHASLLYDVESALFRNDALTRQEIDRARTLARRLGTRLRSPVLDLACGPGRHSLRLARSNRRVTGVDFSEHFLKIAVDSANQQGASRSTPQFVCGDMRALHFAAGAFRTGLILGNSFGYFSDEQNTLTLREMHRVLRNDGFFCLEITNKRKYLATLKSFEQELIESAGWGRLRSEWWKEWDASTARVRTRERHSSALSGAVLYEGRYEVRLYDEAEIEALLESVGFRVTASLPFTPSRETLSGGLGETFGSMTELLFVGARK